MNNDSNNSTSSTIMSQAKAAREALDKAFTAYKFTKSSLNNNIAKKVNVSDRAFEAKLKKFDDDLQELNICHTAWLNKAEPSVEALAADKYSTKWLDDMWDEHTNLKDSIEDIIFTRSAQSAPPVLDTRQKILICTKQMETLQLDIETQVQQLMSRTSSDVTPASHKQYEEMVSNVAESINITFSKLSEDMLSLDPGNVQTLLETHENFRRKHMSDITTIKLQLADHTPSNPSTVSSSTSPQITKGIEMEKSKAPTFTGKTLDYPEFKRGWKKVAGAVWSDGNQVEQIKLKVDSYTKQILTRCKTMSDVWLALDGEYAQEMEVINAVDQELIKLRSTQCTTAEYIVKLRNHLPSLEDVLREVDGLEHLQSPQRVNFLVEKFDDRTLYEWDRFRSKGTGPTYQRFFDFLLDHYDASRSTIARIKSHTLAISSNVANSCTTCHLSNHSTSECPHVQSIHAISVGEECRRCNKWMPRDGVTCPGCGRGTAKDAKIHHCLEHCGAFMTMSVNDRSDCVERAQFCPIHLLGGHQLDDCNRKDDARFICGIEGCAKHHHKSLHASTTPFVARVNATEASKFDNSGEVLLLVQTVDTDTGKTNVFYDNGSTCCLITFSAADMLNLVGESIVISITTVNGVKSLNSFAYSIRLLDKHGNGHIITAFGVANISGHRNPVDISGVAGEFSRDVQDNWDMIDQSSGEIQLLLGMNACGLHPADLEVRGNLKVMSSLFGSGYMIAGTHPNLKSQPIQWNEDVSYIRLASVQSLIGTVSHDVNITRVSVKPSYQFFEGEIMGVEPPRRCGNCMRCKECSFRGQQLSQKEQYEYHVIESKVVYNENQNCFHVQYPFLDDPCMLSSNLRQVIKIAEREEKKLLKEGNLQLFNEQFNKMISGGAIVELSKEDLEIWKGAVHYVSLQHVVTESPTTPFRIVTNSSLSDKRGISLNSILMKGGNELSDQWEILNRWRVYETAMCSDVSKAYWSLRTGETEKHVRRVVWRFGDSSQPWRTFGFCVVSFGDRPAATILEVAIKKIADMHASIDPEVAYRIKSDRYVDDIASGGNSAQVDRFVGEKCDGKYNGTMPDILSRGSLNLKEIVTSGEADPEKLQKLGNSVLGVGWNATSDTIFINLTSNLDKPKKKNVKIQLILEFFEGSTMTMRICLSVVNSIYDPLGLVAPITIRLKVAFRNLFRQELNLKWDDPIPSEDMKQWTMLIQMLMASKSVTFPRASKPTDTVGNCQLICFFDGSDFAYAAVIYIRWILKDGSIFTTILSCKSRVTPLLRISTPRSELNGAVLASRLVLSTVRSLSSQEIPEVVWFIGDSECTLSSIEKVNGAFGEYFGNRIGEILDNQAKIEEICHVGDNGEWWFTASEHNGADRATRLDSVPSDLGPGSDWQDGFSYLKSPRSEWPLNRKFAKRKDDHIPQSELLKKYRGMIQAVTADPVIGIDQLISPYSTNDWDLLVHKTTNIITVVEKLDKSGRSNIAQGTVDAKLLWYRTVVKDTVDAQQQGKLKELDVQDKDGLKVVVGRAQEGLRKFYGKNYLPIVMGHTRLAELIMMAAHYKDHTGRDITMAMARHEAWIINAKKLAKRIIHSCIRCRFIRKMLLEQKISVLPDFVQIQCPPFTHIGLDLCGPYTVKAMTNKRATLKVWVVIFLCLNTKGVAMELAPGYSTADFMLAYSMHIEQRGTPLKVHSDRGSQLVAAKKELCDTPLNYDWDAIAASTSRDGTTWTFAPAGGQWRNGATEAFVKKFKHSHYHLYNDTKLNYAELNCAVKRIANILNHRPISAQRTKSDTPDGEFLSPLTPNMLMTGRSTSGPPRDYVDEEDPNLRLTYLQELERAWWFQYKVQYFQSLIPTRKWIDRKRNVAPGDIVLIAYTSRTAPGTYRLGKVLKVEVDEDELVRTCIVLYKLVRPVSDRNRNTVEDVVSKEIRVPVQRLVMILPVEEQ